MLHLWVEYISFENIYFLNFRDLGNGVQ